MKNRGVLCPCERDMWQTLDKEEKVSTRTEVEMRDKIVLERQTRTQSALLCTSCQRVCVSYQTIVPIWCVCVACVHARSQSAAKRCTSCLERHSTGNHGGGGCPCSFSRNAARESNCTRCNILTPEQARKKGREERIYGLTCDERRTGNSWGHLESGPVGERCHYLLRKKKIWRPLLPTQRNHCIA